MKIELKILNLNLLQNSFFYATSGSAGLDLRACIETNTLELSPRQSFLIPTGIAIHIEDPAYMGIIAARSNIGISRNIILTNGIGIIDSDYQGEIFLPVMNISNKNIAIIFQLERLAQLIIVPIRKIEFNFVDKFSTVTPRGIGGFGSTGRD